MKCIPLAELRILVHLISFSFLFEKFKIIGNICGMWMNLNIWNLQNVIIMSAWNYLSYSWKIVLLLMYMSSYFKHYKSRLLLLQHSFVHLLKCRYTFNLQYLPPLIFLNTFSKVCVWICWATLRCGSVILD